MYLAPNSEGLIIWMAAALSPREEISPMPTQLSGGLIYRGLFRNRMRDKAGLWVSHGRFSKDLPDLGSETVVELTYSIQIAPWLYVTPNVQYIIEPAGRSDIPDAFTIGFESGITF